MSNTFLPTDVHTAAIAMEAMPLVLTAKASLNPEPTPASFALDGAMLAVGAVENVRNAADSVRQRDAVAFTLSAGLGVAYSLAAQNHIDVLRGGKPVRWNEDPLKNRIAGALVCGIFAKAQRVVDRRLGKIPATSWPARELQEY